MEDFGPFLEKNRQAWNQRAGVGRGEGSAVRGHWKGGFPEDARAMIGCDYDGHSGIFFIF